MFAFALMLLKRLLLTPLLFRASFVAVTIGVCIVVPSRLHAQDTASVAAIDALGDDATRAALQSIFRETAAKGLPTAPLVTKVREGIAKRAEPARIRSATALLAQRLELAAQALAPRRWTDELSAGADALQVGVEAATLRDMRRVWPEKSLTVPLGVLAELVSSGVPRVTATRRVRELLVRGASTTQLASLGSTVRADIAAGLAPDASMELRSQGVLTLLLQQNTLGATASPPRPGRPPQ